MLAGLWQRGRALIARPAADGAREDSDAMNKSFCFFFQKEALSYLPLKSGLRFSMKAAMASLESSVFPSSTVKFCSKR